MAKADFNPYLNSDSPTTKDALKAVCAHAEGRATTKQADAMALFRRMKPEYFEALEVRARCLSIPEA